MIASAQAIAALVALLAGLQFCGWSVDTGEPVYMPVYDLAALQPELEALAARREEERLAELAEARAAQEYATSITTTTTTRPPAPPGRIQWRPNVERWRGLVDQYFTGRGESQRALAIMQCESGGNPDAVNPSSGTSGLFQHRPQYWEERSEAAGWAGASVFDPEANIAVSAWLVHTDGWQHWSGRAWGVDSCLEWAQKQGV